jgi:hypothetical protein
VPILVPSYQRSEPLSEYRGQTIGIFDDKFPDLLGLVVRR